MADNVVNSHEIECPKCRERIIGIVWSNGEIEMECPSCNLYTKANIQEINTSRKKFKKSLRND